jgi:hypothetical protein
LCHTPCHKSGVHTKTDADSGRIGTLLQQCDPHDRLRPIHNGTRPFDPGKPWITHVSVQNGTAVAFVFLSAHRRASSPTGT